MIKILIMDLLKNNWGIILWIVKKKKKKILVINFYYFMVNKYF